MEKKRSPEIEKEDLHNAEGSCGLRLPGKEGEREGSVYCSLAGGCSICPRYPSCAELMKLFSLGEDKK